MARGELIYGDFTHMAVCPGCHYCPNHMAAMGLVCRKCGRDMPGLGWPTWTGRPVYKIGWFGLSNFSHYENRDGHKVDGPDACASAAGLVSSPA